MVNRKKSKKQIGTHISPIKRDADVWVPISVAAFLYKLNRVTIFILVKEEKIRSLKYPCCPILVNLEDISKLHPRE